MKVAVCSDLHLEFGPITLENTQNADVLILSGDICVADSLRARDPYDISNTSHGDRFAALIDSCSRNFANTIYVMGNHEHYHGDFAKSADTIRNWLKPYNNVHFLDKESIELNGYIFFGGTLWTDYNNEDELDMRMIEGMMNDYRGVKNSNRMVTFNVPVYKTDENGDYVQEEVSPGFFKQVQIGMKKQERVAQFCAADGLADHREYLARLKFTLEENRDKPFVVVGHHAPSKQSTHPRYAHQKTMNGAYSSNLIDFILSHEGQIKLWTHGHTHEDFDYMIGTTRVVCNPRGYDGYEPRADEFELKVVEV